MHLAGEIDGSLYLHEPVEGFLPGTGNEDRDVFPGDWKFEKNHSVGLNARLGYVPEALDFLGWGRSVYLISGVRWLATTFEAGFDNGMGLSGRERQNRSAIPWHIGTGVEFGGLQNRFDFRLQYTRYNVGFDKGGAARPAPLLSCACHRCRK